MKIRAAALALLSLTHVASADRSITLDRTCVQIDEETDKLAAPSDRDEALRLFRQVLERADLLVVTGDCTETYRLSHEQTGQQYVIHVSSSAGKRRMTTAKLDDLGVKYGKLVHSLIEAKATAAAAATAPKTAAPVATAAATEPADGLAPLPTADAMPPSTTPAPTDTETPAAEEPAHKDRMWYLLAGVNLGAGSPALTGGYRRDIGSDVALDFSLAERGGGNTGTSGFSAAAEILRSTWMSETTQIYGGGGLSLGTQNKGDEYNQVGAGYYYGEGVQGELTAGLRLGGLRAQFVAQLDITIPFYEMGDNSGNKTYAAAGVLSAGLGF